MLGRQLPSEGSKVPEQPRIRWHPLLALQEREPGHWVLLDQVDNQYADIALVRRNGDLGYRSLALRPRSTAPIEAGFTSSLREAAEVAHKLWVSGQALDADRKPSNF
jgi:hypothetical protein